MYFDPYNLFRLWFNFCASFYVRPNNGEANLPRKLYFRFVTHYLVWEPRENVTILVLRDNQHEV